MFRKILVLVVITSLLLTGCSFTEEMEIVEIEDVDVKRINIGMTMGDVVSVLGKHHYNFQNVHYPIAYSWQMSDERVLTIVFKIDDCENQSEYLQMLKNQIPLTETSTEELEEEDAIKYMTNENAEILKEWLQANAKAVSAYVVDKGEKKVLFE